MNQKESRVSDCASSSGHRGGREPGVLHSSQRDVATARTLPAAVGRGSGPCPPLPARSYIGASGSGEAER